MKLNKWTCVLAAFGLASAATAGDLYWEAGDGDQNSEDGYFYGYDDKNDDGTSGWFCSDKEGYENFGYKEDADGIDTDPNDFTEDCMPNDNLEIEFKVTEIDGESYGFAGIGVQASADKDPVDMSGYGGITVTYSADYAMNFQIVGDAYSEADLAYDVHTASMKKGTGVTKYFEWDDFEQAGWGENNGGEAVDVSKIIGGITEMKWQAHTDNGWGDGNFIIEEIYLGEKGGSPVASFADFSYSVAGEALVFSGIEKAMNVEIFDLQGKMVKAAEVSSASNSISLEGLNASSYIVRAGEGQFLLPLTK